MLSVRPFPTFQNLAKQNKFQVKIVMANGGTMDLAKGIIVLFKIPSLPSTITTQSVVSDPRLLVATHLYFPESPGCEFMISMVMTPSVCVIGYLSGSNSLLPLYHLI